MRLINEFISSVGTTKVIIGGISIVVIILGSVIYRYIRLRNVKKELVDLENKMNAIKSLPIQYRLGRVKGIAKGMTDVLKKYEDFANRYSELSQFQGDKIVPLINEIDEQFFYRRLKGSKTKLAKLREYIKEFDEKSHKLLSEIEEVTEIENQQRLRIIKVKEKYRVITDYYTTVRFKLDEFVPEIQNRFKQIDEQFVELESMMNHQRFNESQELTTSIEANIDQLENDVHALPEYVSIARNYIPKKMDELSDKIIELNEKDFSLEKINTTTRFNKIEYDLKRIVDQIKSIQLDGIDETIETISMEMNSLAEDFEKEEVAYGLYRVKRDTCFKHVYQLDRTLQAAVESLDELERNYKLEPETTDIRDTAKEFDSVLDDVIDLTTVIESKDFSYDEMIKSFDDIQDRCQRFDEAVHKYENLYDTLTLQEKRALDELENINIVLLEIKSEIKNKHLPMINDSYKDYIQDSYQKSDAILNFIKQRPIDLNDLSYQIDTARDVIYKLYDNVHNLVVTAEMVEDSIVFGNRYRSSFLEVNTELTKAEILFRNGEYTKALSTAVDIIEKIKPGSYEQLIKKSSNKANSYINVAQEG